MSKTRLSRDSLAKLSGVRLFILPSKLIFAPATALTENEQKTAKLYGVVLTAATLPDTPDAKALTKAIKNVGILDIANASVSLEGKDIPLNSLLSGFAPIYREGDPIRTVMIGPFTATELDARLNLDLQDVKYGDALASLAHLAGFELYLTPDARCVCSVPTRQLHIAQVLAVDEERGAHLHALIY